MKPKTDSAVFRYRSIFAIAFVLSLLLPITQARAALVCWNALVEDSSGTAHPFALNMSAVSMTPVILPLPHGSFIMSGIVIWPDGRLYSAHGSAIAIKPASLPGMPGSPVTEDGVWMTFVFSDRPPSEELTNEMSYYVGNAVLDLWADDAQRDLSLNGFVTLLATKYDRTGGFSQEVLHGKLELDTACTPTP